jgi:hypothetical protein
VIGEPMHYFADALRSSPNALSQLRSRRLHESSSTLLATGLYVTPIITGVVEHPPGEDMAAIAQLGSGRTLPSAGRSPSRLVDAISQRLRRLPDTAAHVAGVGSYVGAANALTHFQTACRQKGLVSPTARQPSPGTERS